MLCNLAKSETCRITGKIKILRYTETKPGVCSTGG